MFTAVLCPSVAEWIQNLVFHSVKVPQQQWRAATAVTRHRHGLISHPPTEAQKKKCSTILHIWSSRACNVTLWAGTGGKQIEDDYHKNQLRKHKLHHPKIHLWSTDATVRHLNFRPPERRSGWPAPEWRGMLAFSFHLWRGMDSDICQLGRERQAASLATRADFSALTLGVWSFLHVIYFTTFSRLAQDIPSEKEGEMWFSLYYDK